MNYDVELIYGVNVIILKRQSLDLYQNQLNRRIPPEIGNLTNLTILRLHTNQLTGEIPLMK